MKDYSGLYLSGRGGALFHYGIKGQKWGVRRFQNEDMTWTEAGKERYGHKGKGRRKALAEAGSKSIKSGKDNLIDKLNKKSIEKNFEVDPEYLKNTKVKDIDLTKLTPKHDQNKNTAKLFIAQVALDALAPGHQAFLLRDAYIAGKYMIGQQRSKKYEAERASEPIDKKTGFHLKTQNLSEKEDIKRVNPEVNDFNSNSKSNCVLCTMTMEMRRRGYDVTANKAGVGYFDHELPKFFKGYKTENIVSRKNGDKTFMKGIFRDDKGFAKEAIQRIEKQPDGSRGNLSVTWMFGMGGHSMFYEVNNGKLKVFDGQTGKIYENPEKILLQCTDVAIGRLDNLEFDPEGIKEACR